MVASAVVRRVSEGVPPQETLEAPAASGSNSRGASSIRAANSQCSQYLRTAVNVYEYGAAQVMRAHHAQYAQSAALHGCTASLFLLHRPSGLTFTCLVCCAVLCCVCSSGIPLAFPQWRDGQLPFNGFADKLEWTVVGTVRGWAGLGAGLAVLTRQLGFGVGLHSP